MRLDDLPALAVGGTKYELLDVDPRASTQDIKLAYRRLALLYHPDRHSDEDRGRAEELFKRIASAYTTLADDKERRRYDHALARHEEFQERAGSDASISLADVLVDIAAYEHAFADDEVRALQSPLGQLVEENLITEVRERVVGVWPLRTTPAGYTHRGHFVAGAVVLTNLRLLLPFCYSWQETNGNVRTTYTGAGMPVFVLPLIESLSIEADGPIRKGVSVEINTGRTGTRFRPRPSHLGKLLLVASLWNIPLEPREGETRRRDLKWALLGPWKWVVGLAVTAVVVAAGIGVLGGHPLDAAGGLISFCTEGGVWQWAITAGSGLSGYRLWRWISAYRRRGLIDAFVTGAPSAAGDVTSSMAVT